MPLAPDNQPTPAWRADRGGYPGWQIALSFVLGWVLVIAGAVSAVALPVSLWRTWRFVDDAVRIEAPIVDFREYSPTRGQSGEQFRPIVAIKTARGESLRVLVGEANYRSRGAIGKRIEVMYLPGHETDAVSNDFDGVWGDTLAIGMAALVCLPLGLGALLWMRAFVRARPHHLTRLDRWFGPLKLLLRLIA